MLKRILHVILAVTLFIGMYSIAQEESLNQLEQDARVTVVAVASAGSNKAEATASITVLLPSEIKKTTKFEGIGAACAGVNAYFKDDVIDRDPPGKDTGASIWIRVNVYTGPGTISTTIPNGPTTTDSTQDQDGGSFNAQDPSGTVGIGTSSTNTQTQTETQNPGTTTTTVTLPEVTVRTLDQSKRHAEVSGSHRHIKASSSKAVYKTLSLSDCDSYMPNILIFTPIGFLIDVIF